MIPPCDKPRPFDMADLQGMLAHSIRQLETVRHEVACNIADPGRHLLDLAIVLMDLSDVRDYFAAKDRARRKYHN